MDQQQNGQLKKGLRQSGRDIKSCTPHLKGMLYHYQELFVKIKTFRENIYLFKKF